MAKPCNDIDPGFVEFVASHLRPIDNRQEREDNIAKVRQRARDYYFELTGKELP